jgi:hypothetical protein
MSGKTSRPTDLFVVLRRFAVAYEKGQKRVKHAAAHQGYWPANVVSTNAGNTQNGSVS